MDIETLDDAVTCACKHSVALHDDSISCYVTLPDNQIIEICLPRKAKGIDVLTEMCKRLDIIETDYFGLQYEGTKGELLWLNLRNEIVQQLRNSRWKTSAKRQAYSCYRLQFRVKFFVPVHMLLQETTREQFYLNQRNAFLDGHLVRYAQTGVLAHDDLVVLHALIAQVELGDHDRQEASELKAQYRTQLRFRPRVSMLVGSGRCEDENGALDAIFEAHRSLSGAKRSSVMYRFLESVSRLEDYGFEYHLVQNSRYEYLLMGVGPDAIKLCRVNEALLGASLCVCSTGAGVCEAARSRRDSDVDAPKTAERGASLRLGAATPVRAHSARGRASEERAGCGKAAGLEGSRLEKALRAVHVQQLVGTCVERLAYGVVARARMDDRVVFLTVADERGDEREFGSRCASSKAAVALYRAISERHAFYRCDSVREDITAQTKRACRSPLASLLCDVVGAARTDFIFDVAHTSRETYDLAKRTLYRREQQRPTTRQLQFDSDSDVEVFVDASDSSDTPLPAPEKCKTSRNKRDAALLAEVARLREQLRACEDDRLCRMCMDAPKQVAFEPCGHFCACTSCAAIVRQCPFCRAPIANTMRIYEAASA